MVYKTRAKNEYIYINIYLYIKCETTERVYKHAYVRIQLTSNVYYRLELEILTSNHEYR